MKLIIDIPKETYEALMINQYYGSKSVLENIIVNGKPLPEHHGRLIDADELYGDFIDGTEGYDCNTWNRIEIGDIIENAPTIIEAEGSESE